jgi:hypothetical protein
MDEVNVRDADCDYGVGEGGLLDIHHNAVQLRYLLLSLLSLQDKHGECHLNQKSHTTLISQDA